MTSDTAPVIWTSPHQDSQDRLDSWKEIASYLGRQVRTVTLWESTESLPVHRHLHSKRGTVYAYKSEIDRWKRARRLERGVPSKARSQPQKGPARIMIAVLPFEDLSPEPAPGYLRDGLTEELIAQLGQASPERLGVIARTTAMHYRDALADISTIGSELEVDYVLEGSIRHSGHQIRISARLVEVTHQSAVWSLQSDEDLPAGVFNAQSHLVSRIAEALTLKLTSAQPQPASLTARAISSEACEDYLKGRHAWNQRTEESLWKAVHYFSSAVQKDPQFAVASSGLADSYNLLAVYGALPPHEAMPLAKRAVTRALQINPNLSEAHVTLADVTLFYDWDWETARIEYQRAILLNPSNSTAHHYYAYYLAAAGEHQEAEVESHLAHFCDPYSIIILVWRAILLRLAGNYGGAVTACLKALELDSQYVLAHWALGLACEQLGEHSRAVSELEEAAWLSGGNPGMLSALGHAQGHAGLRDQAFRTLKHLIALSDKRYVPAYDLAMVHAGLGNQEEAVRLFQKAEEERSIWMVTLPQEPRTRYLWANRHFRKLIENHTRHAQSRNRPAPFEESHGNAAAGGSNTPVA